MTTSTVSQAPTSRAIRNLLGGRVVLRAQPRSLRDWIGLVRRGISASAVDALSKSLRVSQSELAASLGVPERTLARRKRDGMLTTDESAKLLRIARIAGRAREVFEDFDAALDWLKSPNAALDGATPLSLLDTEFGAESVLDTLGRIEHGVFA